MFDIGWSELLVIGIVALVVIGPKDLPQAFRIVGQWVAKARAMAREFQGHVDELMRESEVDEMKREFQQMARPPELEGLEDELMAGRVPAAKPDVKPDEAKADDAAPAPETKNESAAAQ
jgi:sec-independent protein translocase protein TatB